MKTPAKYNRILLKLSGEALGHHGIDFELVTSIANFLHFLWISYDIKLVIVIGGGNLFRGRNVEGKNFDRVQADYMGMLATIMNALAVQTVLEECGAKVRVMSALQVNQACEPYIVRKGLKHLDDNEIVIIAGGTGAAFSTTDTAAALKAAEMRCDVLLKGSTVDGVYTSDPRKDTNAQRYSRLTFQEALEKHLMVMDNTAFAVCQNQRIPVIVFDISDLENIHRILRGEEVGTLITE